MNRPKEPEETREELLSSARAEGYEVSAPQLARWHRQGLLPRPRQHPLGKGHGTRTVYPSGTKDQLLRICEIHIRDGERRLQHVAWQLWWEGYDISVEIARDFLRWVEAELDRLLRPLVNGGTLSDEGWQLVDSYRTKRIKFKPLSWARQLIGEERFDTVMRIMVEVSSGTFEGREAQIEEELEANRQLLEKAFGLDALARELGDDGKPLLDLDVFATLQQASELIRDHPLKDVLESVTDEELLEVRNRVRPIATVLGLVISNAEHVLRRRNPVLSEVGEAILSMRPPYQGLWVYGWLLWRLWGPPEDGAKMDRYAEQAQQVLDQLRVLGEKMTAVEE